MSPLAPARPCRCRRCGGLTTHPSGYTAACRPVAQQAADNTEKRRASHNFLSCAAWRKLRKRILARDPVCKKCGRELATVGAHLIPRDRCEAVGAAMPGLQDRGDAHVITAINRALTPGWRVMQEPDSVLLFQVLAHLGGDRPWSPVETLSWRPLFRRPLALIREGWDLRLDEENVEGWCKRCHDPESGALGAEKVNAERRRPR